MRRHGVADEVGQRAAFAHEAVDAEDQRHAGDRHRRARPTSVAASVMKPAPVTPAAPFEMSIATQQQQRSARRATSWMLVACAMNSAASVM